MGMKKAVKMEVLILVEPGCSDDEILKWTKMALIDWCEFDEAVVKITEKHERLLVDVEANATA